MNSEKYIDLDVHQATISAAVLDHTGKVVMECVLETKAATILDIASRDLRTSMILRAPSSCKVVTVARYQVYSGVMGAGVVMELVTL